ncbi:glycosyltransferase [Candidatus Kaiserbacteria bacterium]|nr:glycosyltransferase [Candidatus Kaiserbacteria bacterium]
MSSRDLSTIDISDSVSSELEGVIGRQIQSEKKQKKQVSVERALAGSRQLETKSTRQVTRVLFISQESELLNPDQQTLDGYLDVSDLFDEVHILILRKGIPPKNPVLRVADNVWLYTAAAPVWWKIPFAGLDLAENQLEFAGGFRPDMIVARDPFESAWVANRLSKKYHRPSQLHVMEDFSTEEFYQENKHHFLRQVVPFLTVTQFDSVRTATDGIKAMIRRKFSVDNLETLPRYQNYEAMIGAESDLVLKDKYKPMIFFMVYIGRLDAKCNLRVAMDAAAPLLRNPRMGLIVIGSGPESEGFKKRAEILGINSQVIFERKVENVLAYLKSANILLVPDTDFASEETVLMGAAAGIPMILARTEKREDLFVDGQSAFLCEKDSIVMFKQRIDELLNGMGLRRQFIMNSQDIIKEQFFNDPETYRNAYQASIEGALFIDMETEEDIEEELA